jgi:hypothetical protein
LTLPSNKRECLLGVLFPTFLFWSPFFLEWIVMRESYFADAAIVYCTKTLTIACQQFQRFVLQPAAVAYCAANEMFLGRVSIMCLWFC